MRIAVIICSLVFDSQKAFMKGIERRVRDWGDICTVFSCHVNSSRNSNYTGGEFNIFDLPDFSNFDGIIYVRNVFQDSKIDSDIINRLVQSKTPCVCIDNYSQHFINLISDEYGCMREITRHLIEVHDCKKLYFLSGPDCGDTSARKAAFLDTLAEHNLPFNNDWLISGTFQYESGVKAANYFLSLGELPDAIVCVNDEMAVGLITELKKRGVSVPRDVKVTGIDYDAVSRSFSPKITTVKRQQYQKGVNAINILHEYREHYPGESTTSPISMFCGESCGCKAHTDTSGSDTATINTLSVDRYLQSQLTQFIKKMSSDLYSCQDYYALLDELNEYACSIEPEELYLCLNVRPEINIDYSDYSNIHALIDSNIPEDYSNELICVVSCQNGDITPDFEREYFEKEDLFPPEAKGGRPGSTYYFLPVHYMNRNFGYAILGTSGELIRNDYFPNWVTIASNALENNRKREVMEQMISTLDHMWIYDTLTGIYNRAGFFKLSESIVKRCIKNKLPICIIFIDVDGLKTVNDMYGHDEGDELIKSISGILKELKNPNELVMRYGGDEFVLLTTNYSVDTARNFVASFEAAMELYNAESGKPYRLEASVGYFITTISAKEELNTLIENADQEMYKNKTIKKAKKNQTPR